MKKILAILTALLAVLCLSAPLLAAAETTTATTGVTFDLTQIVEGLIGILATLVTAYLIPWIKAHTTAQQQAVMSEIVKTLVRAAEQQYGSGKGAEKLAYVQQKLSERGFTIDADAIEAAVRALAIDGGETSSASDTSSASTS